MNWYQLLKNVKGKNIYMFIGNGSKNQFKTLLETEQKLKQVLKSIPKNAVLLYFGDGANRKKPDVGYLFQKTHQLRPDIKIFMIQIKHAQNWGVPSFVTDVYWHNDYTKKQMWGGINKNKEPVSNTKKWVNLHKKHPIEKIFAFGGGPITLDEIKLANKENIPVQLIKIKRRYKGDGKTLIKPNDTNQEKYGITYKLIKKK